MKSTEIWLPVKGHDKLYVVSSCGQVARVTDKGIQVLAPWLMTGGYRQVALSRCGKTRKPKVATLVAEAFIGPRPSPKHQVNHINGIKTDDAASNFEWLTRAENVRHAYRLDSSWHTNKQIPKPIRRILGHVKDVSHAELARIFNISQKTVIKYRDRGAA